jgi:hypothetical protein
MAIDFTPQRWAKVRETYTAWWAHQLDRPIVRMTVGGRDPGRDKPRQPRKSRTAHYDLAIPAEEVVDVWDYSLSCSEYLGDAFPCVWPDFGPGVLAVALGARPQPDENTVWFHPPGDREIAELHLAADLSHPWMRRIGEIMAAAQRRWQGLAQVGMTDLGGNLDIVSTFRPSEKLLLDLYDHPAEVKRVTWEAHESWHAAFDHFNRILQPTNPGYSAWAGIYSPRPYYMLQCDFCYMISTAMFDEFVKPELAATCRRLTNSFYHLDGIGALPHLDSLLSIPELGGIQWVPGEGLKPPSQWPEVFHRVLAAGKLAQFFGGMEDFDRLVDKLGTAKGLLMGAWVPSERRDEALRFLEKYGAD